MNLPIYAHHATPSPLLGRTWATLPENSWSKNHHPKKKKAEISRNHGKMKMGRDQGSRFYIIL